MKDSEVKSDIIDALKPSIGEFANFRKFIKSIEDRNVALVSFFSLL